MLSNHGIEHQDVIRIIGSSTNSFNEAVTNGIATIKEGHESTPRAELDFAAFEVVQLQGTISKDKIKVYQAVMDVVDVPICFIDINTISHGP